MYHIKLDNCRREPKIKMEFTFDKQHFENVVSIAKGGFQQVEVTDADTDEIIYSLYVCNEHFELELDYCEITYCIKDLLKYTKHPRGF